MLAYVPFIPHRMFITPLPSGWQWGALLLIPLIILFAYRFRKRLLTIAAISTLIILLGMSILMVYSWKNYCEIYALWSGPPLTDGLTQHWQISLNSNAGRVQFLVERHAREMQFMASRNITPNEAGLILWRISSDLMASSDFSLINADVLQKKLGFQACLYRKTVPTMPYDQGTTALCSFTCPYWFVYLAGIPALVILAKRINEFRRRRKWKDGLCQNCGYDLRASKEKCPECGTTIPDATKAALQLHAL